HALYLLLHALLPFHFTLSATTHIYTLSLHDALPISLNNIACLYTDYVDPVQPVLALRYSRKMMKLAWQTRTPLASELDTHGWALDRKSTRLNSSHSQISYAVFCLKKKRGNRRR